MLFTIGGPTAPTATLAVRLHTLEQPGGGLSTCVVHSASDGRVLHCPARAPGRISPISLSESTAFLSWAPTLSGACITVRHHFFLSHVFPTPLPP